MLLKDLQKRTSELVRAWPKLRSKALENTKEIALDVITDDQLFAEGIDGDGSRLPLPYAPFTIELKRLKGQPTDRITLKDTGSFYDGVFGKVFGDDILTGSTDSKSADLHQEWGKEILSMTKENTEQYAQDDVLPELIDLTKKFMTW